MLNLVAQGASSKPHRNWRQGPTFRRENTLEGSGSNTKEGGRGLARSGPRTTVPGRSAQASRPSPLQGPVTPPFDLAAIRNIYGLEA
jgi:hypothetical protein